MKNKIINQINNSPESLRSYIHELETYIGNGANMIQEIFQLKEKINILQLYIERNEASESANKGLKMKHKRLTQADIIQKTDEYKTNWGSWAQIEPMFVGKRKGAVLGHWTKMRRSVSLPEIYYSKWDVWYSNYIDLNKELVSKENFTPTQKDRLYEMLRAAFRAGERR